jgi:hypothetical protein
MAALVAILPLPLDRRAAHFIAQNAMLYRVGDMRKWPFVGLCA